MICPLCNKTLMADNLNHYYHCLTTVKSVGYSVSHYQLFGFNIDGIVCYSENIYLSNIIGLYHSVYDYYDDSKYYRLNIKDGGGGGNIFLPKSIMNDPKTALERINKLKVFL